MLRPQGLMPHIDPPAQGPQIRCKFATRFFASLRMTDGVVSAYLQANSLCGLSFDIPRRAAIARAERSEAARTAAVRRGWLAILGGWDSKGKGGFVKSPSLWRAFLPLLSARAERRGPRRVFPLRRLKKQQAENQANGPMRASAPAERCQASARTSSPPVILSSGSGEESKCTFAAKFRAKRGMTNRGVSPLRLRRNSCVFSQIPLEKSRIMRYDRNRRKQHKAK